MTLSPLTLGDLRVSDARDVRETIALIAATTGLAEATVKRRLGARNGNQLIARAFGDRWPPRASLLATLTCAALLRDRELVVETAKLVGSTPQAFVAAASPHPRKRIGSVFPSLVQTASLDRDGLLRTTVADVERLHALGDVAAALGISSSKLRARLEAAHGRALLGRALADLLPATTTTTTKRSKALLAGRYEPGEDLAAGGMGTASLAIDRGVSPPAQVVLKRAKLGAEQARALSREFDTGRSLTHPHLVKVLHLFTDDLGATVLVSEYGGESLHQLITNQGSWSRERVVEQLFGIASALDYLEDRGIHHLDVSPKNIVVDDQGKARLIDFGSSRRSTPDRNLTSTATSLNLRYGAPEMVMGADRAQRADQYSLALVMLWAMLGDDGFDRLGDARRQGQRSFHAALEKHPRPFRRALSDNPEERYSSCSEMVEAIATEGKAGGWLRGLIRLFDL
jgi:hypothetical protein